MKKIILILTFLISVLCKAQDRTEPPKEIVFDMCWKMDIPEKSYWSNTAYIGRYDPKYDKWSNRDGIIKTLYLATIKDYPEYCILIIPNVSAHYKENVSINITGYDEISIHAYPASFEHGCSYFIFPKMELYKTSETVKIYSENGDNCFSEFKILNVTLLNKIAFWDKFYSKSYQKKLNKFGYEFPRYGQFLSIKRWKNVIRFNCTQFQDMENLESNVKLESGYYEIPIELWSNFIKPLY